MSAKKIGSSVLVLPLARAGADGSPGEGVDDCLGIALARSLGRKLAAAGARVLPPRTGPRACDALGLEPPLDGDAARAVLQHAGATHVVQGKFERDSSTLSFSLSLQGAVADAVPANVAARGPVGSFQAVLENAARDLLATLGVPTNGSLVVPHETSSFDAYLALARAQAAWLDGDVSQGEDELAAAIRLDPRWVDPHEAAADAAKALGDGVRRVQALETLARLHREANRSSDEGEALLLVGHALLDQGGWRDGAKAYEAAARLFERASDAKGIVKARSNLASVHLRQGDHDEAIAEYERGLAQLRELTTSSPELEATLAYNLGLAHKVAGDLASAFEHFEEARRLGVEARDDQLVANGHNALGTILDEQGDLERALHQYRRAEEHLEGRADPVLLAGVKDNIGIVLRKKNELDPALRYSEQACALFEVHGDPHRVAIAYVNRAGILLDLERDDEALPFAIAAHRIFVRLESPQTGTTTTLLEDLGVDPDGIAPDEDATEEPSDDELEPGD